MYHNENTSLVANIGKHVVHTQIVPNVQVIILFKYNAMANLKKTPEN